MKVCLIGLGGIGAGYDFHNPALLETHFSALSSNKNVNKLYCVDIKSSRCIPGYKVYHCLHDVPKQLLVETDLFVIATPTNTHLSVILELIALPISQNAKFVVEKPLGATLGEVKKIRDLLINHDVFTNYIRRSSLCCAELEKLRVLNMMKSFNCFFEGEWANIGSHFIDLYLFFTKDDKKTEVLVEDGVLEIIRDKSRARLERVSFTKKTHCPYRFEILAENKRWIGLNGGDTLNFIDMKTRLQTTLINNGLQHYQMLFYNCLFDPKQLPRLATISDAIKVHSILEKINE